MSFYIPRAGDPERVCSNCRKTFLCSALDNRSKCRFCEQNVPRPVSHESPRLRNFKKGHDAIYEGLHKQFAEFNRGLDLERQTYLDGKLWHMAAQLYAAGVKEWPPVPVTPGKD